MIGKIRVFSRRCACPPGHYVGRPSALGNPFAIGVHGDRDEVIARYRLWLTERLERRDRPKVLRCVAELVREARTGKDVVLICWCAPLPCHADIVAEFVGRIARAEASFPVTDDLLDAPDGAAIFDRERLGWYERHGPTWKRRDDAD
jgi:hypothetical protein